MSHILVVYSSQHTMSCALSCCECYTSTHVTVNADLLLFTFNIILGLTAIHSLLEHPQAKQAYMYIHMYILCMYMYIVENLVVW